MKGAFRLRRIGAGIGIFLLAAMLVLASATAPNVLAADSVIEIEFWTLLGGDLAKVLDDQVNEFNESQDRIRIINVNQGGYAPLNQKLLASVAAGNPPVLTMVDYLFVPLYAQEGVFEPIDNWASEADMEDFISGLLADLTYEGKVYALPYNRSTQGMYYNKDLFRAAGLDPERPPATWDEFRLYAGKITDPSKGQYGTYALFNRWFYEAYVTAWGGRINDEMCRPVFHREGGVDVARFFQDLYYEDGYSVMPAVLSGTFIDQSIEFINGQIGMVLGSTSSLKPMADRVDFDWGFAMLPAGNGGRAVTHGGANLAIGAHASPEEKAAAWEFLHFLTGTEQSARMHMSSGYMPTRHSVLELPEVKAFHEENPGWLVSALQLEYAVPTSCVGVNLPEYHNVMTEAIERIMFNRESPERALADAAAELERSVEELRRQGSLILR